MSTVFGVPLGRYAATIPPARPHDPSQLGEIHVHPPLVFVAAAYEYRDVVREAGAGLPGESELNELGAAGWELVSVLAEGTTTHFYFKRQTQ